MKVHASLLLLLPTLSTGTLFLKEIVQGRCYEKPPTGEIGDCPLLVDDLVSVLESHRDSEITVESFDRHFDFVDLSSPSDKAMVFLPFNQGTPPSHDGDVDNNSDLIWTMNIPDGFVYPERTSGGSLLQGLVFCGVDQVENCSVEQSNAYWKFWEALYGRFAQSVKGQFKILVQPNADISFFKRSVISNINPDQITNVTVYGQNCSSSTLVQAMDAFESAGLQSLTCSDDLVDFLLCAANSESPECFAYRAKSCEKPDPNSGDEEASTDNEDEGTGQVAKESTDQRTEEDIEEDNEMDTDTDEWKPRRHHHVFLHFLLFVCIIFCVLRELYRRGYEVGYNKLGEAATPLQGRAERSVRDDESGHALFLDPRGEPPQNAVEQ